MIAPKYYSLYYNGQRIGKPVPKHKALEYYENMSKHIVGLELGQAYPTKPGRVIDLRIAWAVRG